MDNQMRWLFDYLSSMAFQAGEFCLWHNELQKLWTDYIPSVSNYSRNPFLFGNGIFSDVVPQKETLGQHQKYTWLLLIGLEYLVGINLPRGDTLCIIYYIYIAFLTPHNKRKGIKTSHLPRGRGNPEMQINI